MNYYEALGVSLNSEPEVIEAAYRALMKKYHPDLWKGDKAESERRARSINEAYATLRDPQRRRAYDKLHPPDARRSSNHRAGSRRESPNARTRHSAHRAVAYPSRRWAWRSSQPYELTHVRPVLLVALCALVAVGAIVALDRSGFRLAQIAGDQSLGLPPVAASLLSGGRKQTFCITNKTDDRVEYTLYWGGTAGRHYTIEPGYYVVHSSAYSAAPMIKFFDPLTGGQSANVLESATTSERQSPGSCEPSYSFEHKSRNAGVVPGNSRFGLYRDPQVELAPAQAAAARS